jgi:hypothetical protein
MEAFTFTQTVQSTTDPLSHLVSYWKRKKNPPRVELEITVGHQTFFVHIA